MCTTAQANPMCPSYPIVLCGTDGTVLWNPMCTTVQVNPMYPSYPIVLCGTDGTVLWNPTTVQASCTGVNTLNILLITKHEQLIMCIKYHFLI